MFEDVGQPPAGGNDDKRGCVFKDRGGDCAGRSGRHEGRRRAADQTFCGQCDGGISDGQERTPGTAGTECAGEGTASERVPGRVLGCRTVDFGRTERYCIPE